MKKKKKNSLKKKNQKFQNYRILLIDILDFEL